MNNTTNNQNVLPQIKTPKIFIPIIILIVFLVISIFLIMYRVKLNESSSSKEEIIRNVFIILFFGLIIISLCIALLPNFKDIKILFEQISSVTYFIIFTIFLILFFRIMPSNIINNYAYIILPATIIIGAFTFYKAASYSYIDKFDVNYERIKMMIIMFCLITVFIIYYNTDPGGYISKYFGYSLLLTIIISVFAFLYLIIVLTLPDKVLQLEPGAKSSNFLNNFTWISSYGSIAFFIFIIGITIAIATYPGGFLNNKDISSSVIILILLICILFSIVLGANLFSQDTNNNVASNKLDLFKKSLLILFGIIISGFIIAWIVYIIQNYSGDTSLPSLLLNIALVILVLGLIYKIIIIKLPVANSNKNAFFMVILNTLLYIPCFFSGIFDTIGGFLFSNKNSELSGNLIMLILTICIIIFYFKSPNLLNIINKQGGKELVNQPVKLDTFNTLGTYQQLNDSENYDYQYALSFWFFIDATPNNFIPSDSNFSILNYANKPNVFYSTKTQSLVITMDQKDLQKTTNNKLIDFDEDGNRILYKNNNILLQKWNNMVLNYNGGILDIFLNGELVKSAIGVVPYYTLDNLTIGHENGIHGGICNVVYFRHALNSVNIYFLYNLVKNYNPPVFNSNSKEQILKDNINTATSSIMKVT